MNTPPTVSSASRLTENYSEESPATLVGLGRLTSQLYIRRIT